MSMYLTDVYRKCADSNKEKLINALFKVSYFWGINNPQKRRNWGKRKEEKTPEKINNNENCWWFCPYFSCHFRPHADEHS